MTKHVRFRVDASGAVQRGTLGDGAVRGEGGETHPLSAVTLLAPVVPGKLVCVGKNYLDHAKEMGGDVPEQPLLFFKPPSAVIGPGEPIRLPRSARVDHEGEVAVVIGARCRNIKARDAAGYIQGYTCLNDVTDRQAQGWEVNWVRAKGFDTSCPLGPALVTPDELSDPLEVRTRVNGEPRQHGRTDQLAFPIPMLIELISSIMTLEPGDVIATGTPAGVGPLRSGDVVEVEIPGVGILSNPVA